MASQFASNLNPDAGWHPITSDKEELRIAELSNERTRSAFPYYEFRYGERGRKFGLSDGAWILHVGKGDRESVLRELRWLNSVLSPRGMPSWLTEQYLDILVALIHENLSTRLAEFNGLIGAHEEMVRQRQRVLPDDVVSDLSLAYRESAHPADATRIPELGALIAAAIADEVAGYKGAKESLMSWVLDPARFYEYTREAAIETAEKAESIIG